MATATPVLTLRHASPLNNAPASEFSTAGLPNASQERFAGESAKETAPSLFKQVAQSSSLQRWVVIEALVGSVLILAAPFLGDYLAPHGVGGKVLGVVFAVAHYCFHVIGGAVLFKAGLDIGSLSHCHSHKH
ncbi:MAG: hypothetical protein QE263_06750 [Vampirovibrionales bacterium]|nr:hypothetical protein [Vampirovibrionales bacterium]